MKEIELYVNHLLKWKDNISVVNKIEDSCFYVTNPKWKLSPK